LGTWIQPALATARAIGLAPGRRGEVLTHLRISLWYWFSRGVCDATMPTHRTHLRHPLRICAICVSGGPLCHPHVRDAHAPDPSASSPPHLRHLCFWRPPATIRVSGMPTHRTHLRHPLRICVICASGGPRCGIRVSGMPTRRTYLRHPHRHLRFSEPPCHGTVIFAIYHAQGQTRRYSGSNAGHALYIRIASDGCTIYGVTAGSSVVAAAAEGSTRLPFHAWLMRSPE
jgi:hypothetical protein